jgi:hypothetical protein
MRNEVISALKFILDELRNIQSHHLERVLVCRDRTYIQTKFQTLFGLKFNDELHRVVYELVISHALSAEQDGPGGFDSFIETILETSFGLTMDVPPLNCESGPSGHSGVTVSVPFRSDVASILETFVDDPIVHDVVIEALDLAGYNGRIIIERSSSDVESIELINGYTFSLVPCWNIVTTLHHPRILCIDGYVETVGELHGLFEGAHESGERVLLFTRGLSDDVLNTIRVNYDRGTLGVIPFTVKFDVSGINVLNDIAIVSGIDVVSSTKGDLIGAITLSKCGTIDRAMIGRSNVTITSSSTSRRVIDHVEFIRKKRSEQTVDEVASLLDDRIRSLSPNHVVIRLRADEMYISRMQSIDRTLRAFHAATKYGIVRGSNGSTLLSTEVAVNARFKQLRDLVQRLGAVLA